MKKALLLSLFAASFSLLSFTEHPTGKSFDVTPFNYQYTGDLTGAPFGNACTGEILTATGGSEHGVYHGVINNNNLTVVSNYNLQGLKLVAADGTVYTGNGSSSQRHNVSMTNGVFVYDYVERINLLTAGGGNNAVFTVNQHLTINANGIVTERTVSFSIDCQ